MPRAPSPQMASQPGGLRLRLLGAAAWARGDAPRVPLERRDAGVLAYLALEGESPRARLLELLWPDTAPELARNHFRQRLFRLKKACATELITGTEMLAIAAGVAVDALDAGALEAADELLQGLDFSDCPTFFQGVRWIETTARDRVPEEFRDSFLNRNPANRELLRAASRGRLAAS